MDSGAAKSNLLQLLWWNWLLYLAWPAFMTAALLEFTVFALVDPLELHLPGQWELSRHTVYVSAFFVFWLICMLPGAMALFLAKAGVTAEGPDHESRGDGPDAAP